MKFTMFWKKNKLHRSIIIESERWAHLNAQQGLFLKTFSKWICYLGSKTPQICRKVLLLSNFFIILIQFSSQNFFFIQYEILGRLLNTLTAKYDLSRSNRDNLPLPIEIKLPKNRKYFCWTFFNFLASTWNLQCSEVKMSLIGQVFLELLTPKDGLI